MWTGRAGWSRTCVRAVRLSQEGLRIMESIFAPFFISHSGRYMEHKFCRPRIRTSLVYNIKAYLPQGIKNSLSWELSEFLFSDIIWPLTDPAKKCIWYSLAGGINGYIFPMIAVERENMDPLQFGPGNHLKTFFPAAPYPSIWCLYFGSSSNTWS